MVTTRLTLVAGALLLAACHKSPEQPASTDSGHRYLLTPAGGDLRYYGFSGAATPGPDQPLWVAAHYSQNSSQVLLARLDTAGQPLAARTVRFAPSSLGGLTPVCLAALADGGTLLTELDPVRQPLVRLDGRGNLLWSKYFTLAANSGETFIFDAVVETGGDLLYLGRASRPGPLISGRIAADGSQATATAYPVPASVGGSTGTIARVAALPGGGAVFVTGQDDNSLLVGRLDATGQPLWLRQLTVAGFGSTKAPDLRYTVAAAPGGDSFVVNMGPYRAQAGTPSQLVRISAAGALLSATSYTLDATNGYVWQVAVGPQGQAGWLVETLAWLYYYAVDAQGQPLHAWQVAPAARYTTSLGVYGLVGYGARSAYGIGSFVGPAPDLTREKSINLLHLSAAGRAGCQLAAAPTLTGAPAPGTQLTTVPTVAGTARTATLTPYAATLAAETLTLASPCP